jgi:site-specific DNA recombinase
MARIRKTQYPVDSVGAKKKTVWHIAIYIRLSKEDREGKNGEKKDESDSVTNQRKIIHEYIEANFAEGEYDIVGEFIDDGLTGTDDSREEFQKIVGLIERKEVTCFITKNLSRTFRNHADQGYFLEEYFPERGVRYITVADNIKIDTFQNPQIAYGMEVPINGIFNDRFAYATSMSVRATFRTKRDHGEFIGPFAPYGYVKNPANKNHLLIDPEAAEIVILIFEWYTKTGMSVNAITRRLNEQGIPNPMKDKQLKGLNYHNPHTEENDGHWSPKTVRETLKNRVYIGTMVQGRQRVVSYKVHKAVRPPEEEWYVKEGTHEPIISQEMFDQAQQLLEKDVRVSPTQKDAHMLAGLVKCADCKKGLRRKASKGYTYFSCRTYTDKSKGACTKHSIRENKLQQAILLAIQKQIDLIASLADVIEAINKAPKSQGESKRLALSLKQRTAELEKEIILIDSLYPDLKSGLITQEEYLRLKANHTEKSNELKERIQNITAEIEALSKGVTTDEPFMQAFLKHKNITRLERGILVELVDAVHVFEDGSLQIDFNFTDQYQRALDYIEANSREKAELTLIKSIG